MESCVVAEVAALLLLRYQGDLAVLAVRLFGFAAVVAHLHGQLLLLGCRALVLQVEDEELALALQGQLPQVVLSCLLCLVDHNLWFRISLVQTAIQGRELHITNRIVESSLHYGERALALEGLPPLPDRVETLVQLSRLSRGVAVALRLKSANGLHSVLIINIIITC